MLGAWEQRQWGYAGYRVQTFTYNLSSGDLVYIMGSDGCVDCGNHFTMCTYLKSLQYTPRIYSISIC